ncbi:hypothetical protein AH06_41 [Erwinia phage AH06]|nr:hypothetical protein AH06_41 [Erwinia phage AH06]
MNEDLYNVLWDGLVDNGIDPNDEVMAVWETKIPKDIRDMAQMWEWGDTEVRERLYVFIKQELTKP